MKTNKTKEQAWAVEPDMNWTTKEIFYRGWERALASVVEEPVLTEAQIFDVIIENVTDESDDGKWIEERDFFKLAKALRGHIPAIPSDPTPQQEGGLTRAKLERELTLSGGYEWEKDFFDRVWPMIQTELAEAKKGRYAIDWSKKPSWANGVRVEWSTCPPTADGRSHIDDVYPPEAPTPNNSQMREDWCGWWARNGGTREDSLQALSNQLIESKGDMAALWRRDCRGEGVR